MPANTLTYQACDATCDAGAYATKKVAHPLSSFPMTNLRSAVSYSVHAGLILCAACTGAPAAEPVPAIGDAWPEPQVTREAGAASMDASATDDRPDASAHLDAVVNAAETPGASDAHTPDVAVPDGRARASLVTHMLWAPVAPISDPFPDRPDPVSCARTAYMPETLAAEPVFSVDTGRCDYLTVMQTSTRDVAAGEIIKVRVWHFELSAPEPAEAHVAVRVGDLGVLDRSVSIPAPGGLLTSEMVVATPLAAGTPIYFHLHNHGINSWSLVEVSAGSE
jgi:hypothetical protein